MTASEIRKSLKERKDRSAWDKGVTLYALELLESWPDAGSISSRDRAEEVMLNGAKDWEQYSWGGCSLVMNGDIAERLCSPSEYKRVHYGDYRPNREEEWLDTQARALHQACTRILILC